MDGDAVQFPSRVPEFPITSHEINEALADNEGFTDDEDDPAFEEVD
jgi:hypothetical protein